MPNWPNPVQSGITPFAKAEWRLHQSAARRALDPADVVAWDARRDAALLADSTVLAAATVTCYVAVEGEPTTARLRALLATRGVRVLLPRLVAGNDLEFAVDDGTLRPGRHGLAEPAGPAVSLFDADLVLVPALAVDAQGVRLGRGGGSYDRALMRRRPGVAVWALLHPGELVASLPHDPHDVPVNGAVLPDGPFALPLPSAADTDADG